MKNTKWRLAAVLPAGAAAGAVALAASTPRQMMEGPRVIQITAKRFGFTPNQITLKKGETVKLELSTEDVTHGFFQRALRLDSDIEAGKPTEIILKPETAGTFPVICDHFCGSGHGNMKMTIVVE